MGVVLPRAPDQVLLHKNFPLETWLLMEVLTKTCLGWGLGSRLSPRVRLPSFLVGGCKKHYLANHPLFPGNRFVQIGPHLFWKTPQPGNTPFSLPTNPPCLLSQDNLFPLLHVEKNSNKANTQKSGSRPGGPLQPLNRQNAKKTRCRTQPLSPSRALVLSEAGFGGKSRQKIHPKIWQNVCHTVFSCPSPPKKGRSSLFGYVSYGCLVCVGWGSDSGGAPLGSSYGWACDSGNIRRPRTASCLPMAWWDGKSYHAGMNVAYMIYKS